MTIALLAAGGFFNDTLVSFRSNPLLPLQTFMELNPTFKELCALYKDKSTSVEIDSIQAFMSDMITKKRTEIATHRSCLAGQAQVGSLIIPCCIKQTQEDSQY